MRRILAASTLQLRLLWDWLIKGHLQQCGSLLLHREGPAPSYSSGLLAHNPLILWH
jgi:hypothetical protein